MSKRLYLKYGNVLIEEGDTEGKSAYIIERGEVGIFKGDQHICDLGENSIVGEMALITGEPRSATVKSNSEYWLASSTVKSNSTSFFEVSVRPKSVPQLANKSKETSSLQEPSSCIILFMYVLLKTGIKRTIL